MADFAWDYVQVDFVDPCREVDYLEAFSNYLVDIMANGSSSKDEVAEEASFIRRKVELEASLVQDRELNFLPLDLWEIAIATVSHWSSGCAS